MTIELPPKLAAALVTYAEKRKTSPEKLALKYISVHVPSPVEMLTCCECGKQFPNYKKKKFYCCQACYDAAPFPRLGISWGEIQDHYGATVPAAAAGLGVSPEQLHRVIKRFKLADKFIHRHTQY